MIMNLVLKAISKKLINQVSGSSYLKDKVVLITGGSKGLGVVLAEQLIQEGSLLALCARNEAELEQAKLHLETKGAKAVFIQSCDVADKNQVASLIEAVISHFGQLDVIINNAGIIQVGSMESFRHQDYIEAMDVMYWGMVHTTLSALPHMQKRQAGHIVNVTSIGGKVSVPHLLPYNAAKAAAVGFSEGLAAELKKDSIHVTTIVPWLMRTGSYVNAFFQRGNKQEFKLFSMISSTPFLTLSAEKAARRIIAAIKKKRSYKVVGPQATMAIELHHFFPDLTVRLFGIISRLIPDNQQRGSLEQGKEITEREENAEVSGIRKFGQKAQAEHQQLRS